jgi:hypothetical protein
MRDKLNKWIAEYTEFFDPNPHWAGYHNMRRDQGGYEVKAQEACYHVSYLAKSREKGYKPEYTQYFSASRHE